MTMKPASNTKDFISKALKVHDNLYSYDYVVYKKATEKIKIVCSKCNTIFLQQPNNHLSGQGCPKCKGTKRTIESLKVLTKHLAYVFDFSSYTNGKSLIPIYCSKHKNTEYRSVNHIRQRKTYCSKCLKEERENKRKSSEGKRFLQKALTVHGHKYDYSQVEYKTATSSVRIFCNACKSTFKQIPHNHVRGAGCPDCGKNCQGWSAERYRNRPTILYVLALGNSLYKVGITSRNVKKRYSGENTSYTIILQLSFKDGACAWKMEKQILRNFRQFSYKGPSALKRTGTREIITVDPSTYIQGLFNNG